jgi:hypothetical protein
MIMSRFLKVLAFCFALGGAIWWVRAQSGASVELAWTASGDSYVTGYKPYWGVASQTYRNSMNAGNVSSATLSGLAADSVYYCAGTAVESDGLEGVFSNEISFSSGGAPAPPVNLQVKSP